MQIKNERRKKAGLFFAVLCMLFALGLFWREQADAYTYVNAYTFFKNYDSKMVLEPGNNQKGEIYYATRGKSSSSGIKYTNLGWKVSITNSSGYVIDTIYYQTGGSHMVQVDSRTVNGYVYTLYMVELENLKERMSADAKTALTKADCNILFDACMTTKINGKVQGGMTDYGPSWGMVYTTYDGIVNAQDWSAASKETLKTYYNKEVTGLFHTIYIGKIGGIANVTGAGRYCYGTEVVLTATVREGYVFSMWDGPIVSTEPVIVYKMGKEDVYFRVGAKMVGVRVNYYRGDEIDGNPTETDIFFYNTPNQYLQDFGWQKEGYHQIGWSRTPNAAVPEYTTNSMVMQFWLEEVYPKVNLYAVWEENQYTIVYHANGGSGEIPSVLLKYSAELTLPAGGFTHGENSMLGWGLYKTKLNYNLGESVRVSAIVNSLGMQYMNDLTINIYAIWGRGPLIYGHRIYVSLADARAGKVTEEKLGEYIYAWDKEDGTIRYGIHRRNSLQMTSYSPENYTLFEKNGMVTETFCAIDSHGNKTEKDIQVYIVDTGIYENALFQGSVRFISREFYKDENGNFLSVEDGGLFPMSVWRYEEAYQKTLDALFLGQNP